MQTFSGRLRELIELREVFQEQKSGYFYFLWRVYRMHAIFRLQYCKSLLFLNVDLVLCVA